MSDEFLNENINSYEGEEENKYDDYDNSEINNTDLNGEYKNKGRLRKEAPLDFAGITPF